MAHHLMIVPSLACPASCGYCFGPHRGDEKMTQATVAAIIRWQNGLDIADEALEITFHGGEPLVPGLQFYQQALPTLREGLAPRRVRFSLQSNLWFLTDELCALFRDYRVSIGTSLDGPEEICDGQRGQGYYRRTMASVERARDHGLDVGCICTFTAQSIPQQQAVVDFFMAQGLNFSVHAAMPSLRHGSPNGWAVSAEAHGDLLVGLLDYYLQNLPKVRIGTLDSMCRSVSAGKGQICTFGDCLGHYLAVGPNGDIYPCQRFAGMAAYRLGNVHDVPTSADLEALPVWRMFAARQEQIEQACGECDFLNICRGGCPYNVLAANQGSFDETLRDPHCAAYKRLFSHVTERAMAELFSEENMAKVVARPDPQKGLMRQGPLLSIMRDGPHPYEIARNARRLLASVALAATNSPAVATQKLQTLGILPHTSRMEAAMQALHTRLNSPVRGLRNLYLHVTFACPLRCTHCYANAGNGHKGTMAVADVIRACREAATAGFRHAVITGGEPLVHPQRLALLEALRRIRSEVKPLDIVLRTSLTLPLDETLLWHIGHGTDEVVVSVDGDRQTHDARRGRGSYDLTVHNLRALAAMGYDTDLSLAAVLPTKQINGEPGEAVRALAQELGIRRTRFRPVLPLGRAREMAPDMNPETLWGHQCPQEVVAGGFSPVTSCGIGQNLYVEPDGSAYPCYAWHGPQWKLGAITGEQGMTGILESQAFQALGCHTVNSNRRCGDCALRYLCGGACRAWDGLKPEQQIDLDAPPALNCDPLYARANALLQGALTTLQVPPDQWTAAGLPLWERLAITDENKR